MYEVFQNLLRSILGGLTPRIDGLDCDCGGSDSDCGGSDCDCGDACNASDCNASDCAEASSSADVITDSSEGTSGSSSDRRTKDAALIGGAAAGAAVYHNRKKGQRDANDATDEDLRDIPRCQRPDCRERGQCDCGGGGGDEPYGKRPVRIRLRKS